MTIAETIRKRLEVLQPSSLDLVDESSQHAGHSGWREGGGTHWRLAIVSPRFAGTSGQLSPQPIVTTASNSPAGISASDLERCRARS